MMRCRVLPSTALVFLASFLSIGPGPAWAAVPEGTDRVEEDWELTVTESSVLEAGPQITTTMAPEPDPARTLMHFNLNYREEPFAPGGLQVQCYYDDLRIALSSAEKNEALATPSETIRWTQRLSVSSNVLTYEIVDGQSTTWGTFGQGSNLKISVTTHVTALGAYDSAFSVNNSGVGWQSNLASQMRLLRVRYYKGESLLRTDEAPSDGSWNINLHLGQ